VWQERIALLSPYQVTTEVMEKTGNPNAKFLHCLPAIDNRDTEVGEAMFRKFGMDCMAVTDEVFESRASVVLQQAENRIHTIKALLVATMGP
jgi:ornithine carbamoyltransferase